MGYEDIEIAKIRVDEALKMGLESQRVHRELSEGRSEYRLNIVALLRTKLLGIRISIVNNWYHVQCRVYQFIYATPDCA